MFIVLKQAGYFSRQHLQPLLLIAFLLSLPGWILDYTGSSALPKEGEEFNSLGANLLITTLAVVQFAAAMLYIHQQVLGRPISALQAIALGASRIGPLLLINILMALAIALGLMLLVAPGLYIAYKLMFSEFYLLLHGQGVLQALRSSYRDTTDRSDKLLPPLLIWGGLVAGVAVIQQLLLQQESDRLLINLLSEGASMLLMLWGWAIIYRLYQLYIAPAAAQSAPPIESTPQPPTKE